MRKQPKARTTKSKSRQDNFYDIKYYFSPYTNGQPYVSIYFYHKIADNISTFMKTLNLRSTQR